MHTSPHSPGASSGLREPYSLRPRPLETADETCWCGKPMRKVRMGGYGHSIPGYYGHEAMLKQPAKRYRSTVSEDEAGEDE